MKKNVFTFFEASILFFIFKNMAIKTIQYNNKLIFILAFALLFILFLLKYGYISQFFDNKYSYIIGKYTYSIFITHTIIRNIWFYVFLNKENEAMVACHPLLNIFSIFFLSIILGILTYHLVEKPIAQFLKKKPSF